MWLRRAPVNDIFRKEEYKGSEYSVDTQALRRIRYLGENYILSRDLFRSEMHRHCVAISPALQEHETFSPLPLFLLIMAPY